jgi:hypothetical protein
MIQYMMATVPTTGVSRCPICSEALGTIPDAQPPSETASVVQAEQALATRMADPTFRANVRAVRSKIRAAQRAVGAMNRRLAERAHQFRETVAPHVAAIRDAKREAHAEIRLFTEVREATKSRTAAKRAITLFSNREHIGYWNRRELFKLPFGRRRSRYRHDPGRNRFWLGI